MQYKGYVKPPKAGDNWQQSVDYALQQIAEFNSGKRPNRLDYMFYLSKIQSNNGFPWELDAARAAIKAHNN